MIALDTNVLAYLVVDQGQKTKEAASLMMSLEDGEQAFISLPVVSEFYFVLLKSYKLDSEIIINTISKLLLNSNFLFESEEALLSSVSLWRKKNTESGVKLDFPDVVISQIASANDSLLYTFDKKAARYLGAKLLGGN